MMERLHVGTTRGRKKRTLAIPTVCLTGPTRFPDRGDGLTTIPFTYNHFAPTLHGSRDYYVLLHPGEDQAPAVGEVESYVLVDKGVRPTLAVVRVWPTERIILAIAEFRG